MPQSMLNGRAVRSGTRCSRSGSAGRPSITATASPRQEGSTGTIGLGPIVANRSDPGSWIIHSTASIHSFIHMANREGVGPELYKSVLVCIWEIIPTDE